MLYQYVIKNNSRINIKETLFSGQSFSWNYFGDNQEYYSAIINSKPIILQQLSDFYLRVITTVNEINGISVTDFIHNYFTLDIDPDCIFPENFHLLYPEIWQLLTDYFSVKIMRQDPFETMISFMCAQGIGMHLIRKQASMLRKTYGEISSVSFSGKEIILHRFPSPERLAAADPMTLSKCTNNNRVRARNIILAAQGVAEGTIDFDFLSDPQLPLTELRRTLCLNGGIGYKIADCIALFGLGRLDAFPIDTHVKQYLGQWFNSATALRSLSPANYLVLDAEARALLNPDFAGYAGHLLFHCWRREIKRLRTF